jgi:hypothetical protein
VFDEDRGWSWSQEEDGNTGCNSDFIVEYLVEAAVAAEESAQSLGGDPKPSSTSLTPSTLEGTASALEAAPSADSPPSAAPSSSLTYGSNYSRLDNDHDDVPLRYRIMEDLLSEPYPSLEQVELEEAELMVTSTGDPCSFAEAEWEEAWRVAMRN